MPGKRLLLSSNSKNYGERYLAHAEGIIKDFLGSGLKRVLFIPFAGVRVSFDEFAAAVGERFFEMGYGLESIHRIEGRKEAIDRAEAIVVGGGNTFHLLGGLYKSGLIEAIRERVLDGTPYIGWSAGSNIACPTIKTTNDMPITEPPGFDALSLVPFQINPHYTDAHPVGHQGETRAERLAEFCEVNPGIYVVGLREGSSLLVEGSSIRLLGEKEARIFKKGLEPADYSPGQSLQFLL